MRALLLRWLPAVAYGAAWLVVFVPAVLLLFVSSERIIDVASHRAVVSPDLTGEIVVRTGPLLPDLRTGSGSAVGVEVALGKTDAGSVEELTQRYAAIATHPEAPVGKVERAVRDMAVDAAARAAAIATLPLLVWWALGRDRRRELVRRLRTRPGIAGLAVLALVAIGLTTPWREPEPSPEVDEGWLPLSTFLGPSVPLPEELRDVEVLGGPSTAETRRLIGSAISSYQRAREFYVEAAEDATELELRPPEEDETVVLLVSDRHDNIGMDAVARAIADRAGATAVFDAGDDTSTGEEWEAFSLDSLNEVFDDLDRWAVTGNHDHGDFVRRYLDDLGWQFFDDEVIDGPGDTRILGVDDPRSSGLGDWREETGLSFGDVEQRLADAACEADAAGDRVDTLLVHDTNLGRTALARGCVDLVLGGHTHVQDGPTPVVGENGETGYRFTNGTTGGAAYAIAIGSKLRRAAGVALITYRDGRAVGIQGVTLQTTGRYDVDDYVELTY